MDSGIEAEIEAPVLVVVGASLRAEVEDRGSAYRLREAMLAWMDGRYGAKVDGGHPCGVVVCTDVWYLNDAELRARPTVSIGGPSVNAFSAYLADKLPSAYVINDVLMVQWDVGGGEPLAACWGVDGGATWAAVEAFVERYLEGFMEAGVGEG